MRERLSRNALLGVRRMNRNLSYGLALNALAHRPEYGYGDDVPHLVAAAKAALTAADIQSLREGG